MDQTPKPSKITPRSQRNALFEETIEENMGAIVEEEPKTTSTTTIFESSAKDAAFGSIPQVSLETDDETKEKRKTIQSDIANVNDVIIEENICEILSDSEEPLQETTTAKDENLTKEQELPLLLLADADKTETCETVRATDENTNDVMISSKDDTTVEIETPSQEPAQLPESAAEILDESDYEYGKEVVDDIKENVNIIKETKAATTTDKNLLKKPVIVVTAAKQNLLNTSKLNEDSSTLTEINKQLDTPKSKSHSTDDKTDMEEIEKSTKTELICKHEEILTHEPIINEPVSRVAEISTPTKSIRKEISTPKTPVMIGVRELLKTPKPSMASTPKLAGLRNIMQTPKQNANLTNFEGLTELVQTPKAEIKTKELEDDKPSTSTAARSVDDFCGMREMLKTPKSSSTPRLKGLREMMQTPKVCATPHLAGVKELLLDNTLDMESSVIAQVTEIKNDNNLTQDGDGEGLDKFFRTPRAKNLMIPGLPASAIIEKSADSVELVNATEYDLNNTNMEKLEYGETPIAGSRFVGRLLDTDDEDSADVIKEKGPTSAVDHSEHEVKNLSAEEAFDKLIGQESTIQTPAKNVYTRKTLAQNLQQQPQQSPFSAADVLSDLPKTDIQEWVDSLEEAEKPDDFDETINTIEDSELSLEIEQSKSEFSQDPLMTSTNRNLSTAAENGQGTLSCAKIFLKEVANATNTSSTMLNVSTASTSLDPLANSILKTERTQNDDDEKKVELIFKSSQEADMSGIGLLDATCESEVFESLVVTDESSDGKSEIAATEIQETSNKLSIANQTVENNQVESEEFSEVLIVSDTESVTEILDETTESLRNEADKEPEIAEPEIIKSNVELEEHDISNNSSNGQSKPPAENVIASVEKSKNKENTKEMQKKIAKDMENTDDVIENVQSDMNINATTIKQLNETAKFKDIEDNLTTQDIEIIKKNDQKPEIEIVEAVILDETNEEDGNAEDHVVSEISKVEENEVVENSEFMSIKDASKLNIANENEAVDTSEDASTLDTAEEQIAVETSNIENKSTLNVFEEKEVIETSNIENTSVLNAEEKHVAKTSIEDTSSLNIPEEQIDIETSNINDASILNAVQEKTVVETSEMLSIDDTSNLNTVKEQTKDNSTLNTFEEQVVIETNIRDTPALNAAEEKEIAKPSEILSIEDTTKLKMSVESSETLSNEDTSTLNTAEDQVAIETLSIEDTSTLSAIEGNEVVATSGELCIENTTKVNITEKQETVETSEILSIEDISILNTTEQQAVVEHSDIEDTSTLKAVQETEIVGTSEILSEEQEAVETSEILPIEDISILNTAEQQVVIEHSDIEDTSTLKAVLETEIVGTSEILSEEQEAVEISEILPIEDNSTLNTAEAQQVTESSNLEDVSELNTVDEKNVMASSEILSIEDTTNLDTFKEKEVADTSKIGTSTLKTAEAQQVTECSNLEDVSILNPVDEKNVMESSEILSIEDTTNLDTVKEKEVDTSKIGTSTLKTAEAQQVTESSNLEDVSILNPVEEKNVMESSEILSIEDTTNLDTDKEKEVVDTSKIGTSRLESTEMPQVVEISETLSIEGASKCEKKVIESSEMLPIKDTANLDTVEENEVLETSKIDSFTEIDKTGNTKEENINKFGKHVEQETLNVNTNDNGDKEQEMHNVFSETIDESKNSAVKNLADTSKIVENSQEVVVIDENESKINSSDEQKATKSTNALIETEEIKDATAKKYAEIAKIEHKSELLNDIEILDTDVKEPGKKTSIVAPEITENVVKSVEVVQDTPQRVLARRRGRKGSQSSQCSSNDDEPPKRQVRNRKIHSPIKETNETDSEIAKELLGETSKATELKNAEKTLELPKIDEMDAQQTLSKDDLPISVPDNTDITSKLIQELSEENQTTNAVLVEIKEPSEQQSMVEIEQTIGTLMGEQDKLEVAECAAKLDTVENIKSKDEIKSSDIQADAIEVDSNQCSAQSKELSKYEAEKPPTQDISNENSLITANTNASTEVITEHIRENITAEIQNSVTEETKSKHLISTATYIVEFTEEEISTDKAGKRKTRKGSESSQSSASEIVGASKRRAINKRTKIETALENVKEDEKVDDENPIEEDTTNSPTRAEKIETNFKEFVATTLRRTRRKATVSESSQSSTIDEHSKKIETVLEDVKEDEEVVGGKLLQESVKNDITNTTTSVEEITTNFKEVATTSSRRTRRKASVSESSQSSILDKEDSKMVKTDLENVKEDEELVEEKSLQELTLTKEMETNSKEVSANTLRKTRRKATVSESSQSSIIDEEYFKMVKTNSEDVEANAELEGEKPLQEPAQMEEIKTNSKEVAATTPRRTRRKATVSESSQNSIIDEVHCKKVESVLETVKEDKEVEEGKPLRELAQAEELETHLKDVATTVSKRTKRKATVPESSQSSTKDEEHSKKFEKIKEDVEVEGENPLPESVQVKEVATTTSRKTRRKASVSESCHGSIVGEEHSKRKVRRKSTHIETVKEEEPEISAECVTPIETTAETDIENKKTQTSETQNSVKPTLKHSTDNSDSNKSLVDTTTAGTSAICANTHEEHHSTDTQVQNIENVAPQVEENENKDVRTEDTSEGSASMSVEQAHLTAVAVKRVPVRKRKQISEQVDAILEMSEETIANKDEHVCAGRIKRKRKIDHTKEIASELQEDSVVAETAVAETKQEEKQLVNTEDSNSKEHDVQLATENESVEKSKTVKELAIDENPKESSKIEEKTKTPLKRRGRKRKDEELDKVFNVDEDTLHKTAVNDAETGDNTKQKRKRKDKQETVTATKRRAVRKKNVEDADEQLNIITKHVEENLANENKTTALAAAVDYVSKDEANENNVIGHVQPTIEILAESADTVAPTPKRGAGKGRRKVKEEAETEASVELSKAVKPTRSRKRKESHTEQTELDSHDELQEPVTKRAENHDIATVQQSTVFTPETKRLRNVPRRAAAAQEHNYDESSDTESHTAYKRTVKRSPASSQLKDTKKQPELETMVATTSRGRTRKPTARVQQFLEEERIKAETPKKRLLLAALMDSATPQKTPSKRGRKPSTIDTNELVATPQSVKKGRGRGVRTVETPQTAQVEIEPSAATQLEERSSSQDASELQTQATATKARGGRKVRKVKAEQQVGEESETKPIQLHAQEQHNEGDIEEASSSPLQVEAIKRTARGRGRTAIKTPEVLSAENNNSAEQEMSQPTAKRVRGRGKAKIQVDEEQTYRPISASTIEGSIEADAEINNGEDEDEDESLAQIAEKAIINASTTATATTTVTTTTTAKRGVAARKAQNTSDTASAAKRSRRKHAVATDDADAKPNASPVQKPENNGRGRKVVRFEKADEIAAAIAANAATTVSAATNEPTSEEPESSAPAAKRVTRTRRK